MTLHDEVDDLVAAFSLGAVSDVEGALVRSHLPDCPECQATLLRMTEVVAVLPLSLEEIAPPDGLRERLLASAGEAAPRGAVMTGSLGNDARGRDERRRPASDRGRLLFLRRVPSWAPVAAAAVLLVAMFGWNLSLQNRPAAPSATMQATLVDTSRSGVGTITYLRDQHLALVSFHALSAPRPDKNYELWVIPKGGRPQPAGVFLPEPDGTKTLVINRPINHGDTIAVTQEAPGGAPQPTGAVEITASI
jgi:anti-sigma-K factor RskA